MDSAIHKKTGQIYPARDIWKRFDNKTIHKKGTWLCLKEEIENIDEIKEDIYVTPVKPHRRRNIGIPSFFRLYPGYSDNVILRKESEEHKKAKTVVWALLTEEFNFQLEYDKDVFLMKNLPVDYEKIRNNIRKFEVVKNNTITKQWKKTDACLPFIFNSFFGNGLAIEIKKSEGDEKVEDKEDFWFQRGYSVIWVNVSDLDQVDGRWGVVGNKLQVIPCSVGYNKIMNDREERMMDYLHSFKDDIEACAAIISDFKNMSFKTCRTCKHGKKDRDNPDIVTCFVEWDNNTKSGNITKHEPLDGCDAHE